MEKKFIPKPIGEVSIERKNEIFKIYQKTCDLLSLLYSSLYDSFGQIDLREFFKLIRSPFPEKLIIAKYVELRQPDFGELDLQALINANLAQLPDNLKFALEEIGGILEQLSKIRDIGFYFPFAKLFKKGKEEREGYFEIENSTEFIQELDNKLTSTTQSQIQNEILQGFQQIQDAVCFLHELGIVNLNTHGPSYLGLVGLYFEKNKNRNPGRPIAIKSRLFEIGKLKKYLIGNKINRYPSFDHIFFIEEEKKDAISEVKPIDDTTEPEC